MKHFIFAIALCAFTLSSFSQVRRTSQGVNWQTKARELQKEVDQLKYVNDSLETKLNFFLQQEKYKPLALQVDPSTGTVYELQSVSAEPFQTVGYFVYVTVRVTNNTADQYVQLDDGLLINSDGERNDNGNPYMSDRDITRSQTKIYKGVTVNTTFHFLVGKHARQLKLFVFKDDNTGKEFRFENIDIYWKD